MYIGEHQRLHGEVKVLPKAVGVVRKRQGQRQQQQRVDGVEGEEKEELEELEVVEIVRHKIVFASRPEPVTRGEMFAGRE